MSHVLDQLARIEAGRAGVAAGERWLALMRRGEFAAAWELSDAALRTPAGRDWRTVPRHQQAIWDGTPLEGRRVLIRCYHGLGDTVQFVRYVPRVSAIAREVIVWAQPVLLPLLRALPARVRFLPLHDGTPEVDYDVDAEVMELPHVFRSTLATLPAGVPYFEVPPARRPGAPGRLEVGLAWSGGDWEPRRNLPTADLAALWRLPGVRLHSVQPGPVPADWPRGAMVPLPDPSPLAVARLMGSLDLVISLDSFPAHLGGALGVPVWTLLPAPADWRWMDAGNHSPWYPTMRLFRQHRPGDWTGVIGEVTDALAALAATRLAPARRS